MNRRFVPPARDLPWPIAYEGVVFIAEFEQGPEGGFGEEAYRCSAGVWTIGWGETDEDKAIPGATCTKEQADRWLCDDLTARAHKVRALCKVKPGPHELAAMVSLTYNIGLAAFETSSILRRTTGATRWRRPGRTTCGTRRATR
jgi:GH24 family phage-related lysozyme (muramidase)